MSAQVGLLCDFREEGWRSMDLVADMLFDNLCSQSNGDIRAQLCCPPFWRLASKLPGLRHGSLGLNFDRVVNRYLHYPQWLRRLDSRFDLFHVIDHSYAQLAHELPAERVVIHCHDLDAFRCLIEPEREPRPAWFRAIARRVLTGLQRAAHVICISKSTHHEIVRHQLIAPERLSICYLGMHPALGTAPNAAADERARRLLGAAGAEDILHVGSSIPRKRIEVLLEAFAAIAAGFPAARIVRIGALTKDQKRLAEQLGIANRVVCLTGVDWETLAALYRQAAVLVQCSDAEGFGLPVAEAMFCGCVVIASDIPALREAGGDTAIYFPTGDHEALAGHLRTVLEERRTNRDSFLRRQVDSSRHAQQFSWAQTARDVMDVYRKVLNRGAESRNA